MSAYIDINRFSGLTRQKNEAIKYKIIPSKNDEETNGPGPSKLLKK